MMPSVKIPRPGPPGCRRCGLLLSALALVVAAALPYAIGGVSRTAINMDDAEFVYQNPFVLKGLTLAGARWALTTFQTANWHPLTWLSLMLDVSLFGPDPWRQHLVNIALHAVTTALLFLALRRMSGAPRPSAFVAALFGVHPLHIESVAWIAQRKDVLAALFFALLLLAYERYCRRRGRWRYGAVFLLLALGLGAKPTLVTAPFALLLLDIWPFGRTRSVPAVGGGAWRPATWASLLVEKIPLLALSATVGAVTVLAQRSRGAIAPLEAIPAGARIANALVAYVTYLGKTLWPSGLAIYYPFPSSGHPWWRTTATALLLAAVSGLILAQLRRRPFLAVGWFWFLGMLLPVIGLLQVGWQALADRYTYLPLVGLFFIPAWGLPEIFRSRRHGVMLGIGGGALLTALTAAAAVQAGYWRDGGTLYTHTLAVTAKNWLIHNNLGLLRYEEGRYDEALSEYSETLRIRPDYAEARNNIGVVLVKVGRIEEGIAQYREALRLRPDLSGCRLNLAHALASSARFGEALEHYREVVRVRPADVEARYEFGNTLAALGRFEEAAAQFREALRLRPGHLLCRLHIGNALTALGRLEEAKAQYLEILRVAPDSLEARFNLGNLLAGQGRLEEAAAQYREALRIRPDRKETRDNLKAVLDRLGQRS